MDQEYFICGLCKWCINAKYWRNTEFNFFSGIIFKRGIRVHRTNKNRPIQSLDYVESTLLTF